MLAHKAFDTCVAVSWAILLAVQYCDANSTIRCFDCSTPLGQCNDRRDGVNIGVLDRCDGVQCSKVTVKTKVENIVEEFTTRSCVTAAKHSDGCQSEVDGVVETTTCYCTGKYCNHANRLEHTQVDVLVTAVFVIAVLRLFG